MIPVAPTNLPSMETMEEQENGQPEKKAAKPKPAPRSLPKRSASRRKKGRRKASQSENCADVDNAPSMSSSLYLGYVEDNESIDMIMKKFEKLDQLQQKKSKKNEDKSTTSDPVKRAEEKKEEKVAEVAQVQGNLTEKEMEDLFKETSTFKLETALKDSSNAYESYFYGSGDDDDLIDEEDEEDHGWDLTGVSTRRGASGEKYYLFSDNEEMWDDILGDSKKSKRKRKQREDGASSSKPKRIAVSASQLDYVSVPTTYPLPESWGRMIHQYTPPENVNARTFWKEGEITNNKVQRVSSIPEASEHLCVSSTEALSSKTKFFEKLKQLASTRKGGFEGIVLSPPWKERYGKDSASMYKAATQTSKKQLATIEPEDLLLLKLGDDSLLRAGFIYVWVPKHLAVRVLKVMRAMNYFYVENGVNVRLKTTNRVGQNDTATMTTFKGSVFTQAHETCLIFRKGYITKSNRREWHKVEIRHQRTTDVKFSFYRQDAKGLEEYYHDYLYNMVETMVPLGRFNPEAEHDGKKQEGRLLHLWAPPSKRRTGWVTVCIE